MNNTFKTLRAINVNEHTETLKQGNTNLTYLSWAWAIDEVMRHYPDTSYKVVKFDGKPYLYDEDLGYMVFTEVTIEGQTKEMWLPVMDGANKAMKNHAYFYEGFKYKYGKRVWNEELQEYEKENKTVQAATMFDINKTIMRCLVKNLGMFGLGLYIYAGEDLPMLSKEDKEEIDMNNAVAKLCELQTKMNALCIDWRGEIDAKTKAWILEKSKSTTQDVTKVTLAEAQNLIKAYNTLILAKEKEEKENA